MTTGIQIPVHVTLNEKDFEELSAIIYSSSGIKMPETKRGLVENRLQKRLKHLNLEDFRDYIDVIKKEDSSERKHMIDEVTTNKTYFFRESDHFSYLREVIIPEFIALRKQSIRVWCSACSSGEEAYSLAIEFEKFQSEKNIRVNYDIIGTDISTKMIEDAKIGIYTDNSTSDIPKEILSEYFLQSVHKKLKLVKIGQAARRHTYFFPLNLMNDWYDVPSADLIFCRNVLIYFDRKTQEEVISKTCNKLNEGGYLFISHSESILGFNVPLKKVGPSIYQKI